MNEGGVGTGQGHDPTRPILGDLLGSRRQGQWLRRADAEFTPVAVEPNRPPPHADRPAGQQVARCFEQQILGSADPQKGELRAAGNVPEHHAAGSCPGPASPAIGPDRHTPIPELLTGMMSQSPILERRLDLVGRQLVFEREDDSPVVAEVIIDHGLAGFVQPGLSQDRIPEPQSTLPAVARQQRAGPVEARAQAPIGMALESRPPNARWRRPRGKSCYHHTLSPAWYRRDSIRRSPVRA